MSVDEKKTWTETALAPLAAEIARLKADGVTESDLKKARTILANSVGLKVKTV